MSQIPLYLSAPHPCSYRPGQIARSAFLDPRLALTLDQREALAAAGFRRTGGAHYRPACAHCQACESVRVAVAQFRPNRAQRRCQRDNADLKIQWAAAQDTDERYALYRRYLLARHQRGEMDPDDRQGFARFLCDVESSGAQHLLFRDRDDSLLAVAVADRWATAYSAVYTFFDPEHAARSLGRFAVLQLIEESRLWGLDWLYLGYRVADCRKMNYKGEYQPQQRLIDGRWISTVD